MLDLLMEMLKANDCVVIKLHPEERDDKYAFVNDPRVAVIRHLAKEHFFLGDVIIAMASMLLLELAMYRNDVISFRPGATKGFIGEQLGATVDATSIEDLGSVVDNRKIASSSIKSRFAGPRERILRFLEYKAR